MTTITMFTGDSITDAGRRTDPSGLLGAGYVRRVAEIATAHQVPLTVINTGVSGDRTTDLLARWEADVITAAPDVLTVLVGANDMWRRYDSNMPMTADEFAANYRTLLDRVRSELDLQTLVLMDPFLIPISAEQGDWYADDLAEKIERVAGLAADYDAIHIPLHEILSQRAASEGPRSVIDDGVHPSAGGHELIAQSWWAAVSPALG